MPAAKHPEGPQKLLDSRRPPPEAPRRGPEIPHNLPELFQKVPRRFVESPSEGFPEGFPEDFPEAQAGVKGFYS